MSFGAVLLAAGAKGKRLILPNARVMIHQPLIRGGLGGQETDIRIEGSEMQQTRKRLSEILAQHTGQPFKKLDADIERNFYLSAEEAVAYGLADKVIPASKL
jgi:ATP-dependent Clp protease protease subunit